MDMNKRTLIIIGSSFIAGLLVAIFVASLFDKHRYVFHPTIPFILDAKSGCVSFDFPSKEEKEIKYQMICPSYEKLEE